MTVAEKLAVVAENEQKVFAAGYAKGKAEGGGGGDTDVAYQQGVADGKQAEYDKFWDTFQKNGEETNYRSAFAYARWKDETFNPKYVIKPTTANNIFYESGITNLAGCSKLDFSNCTEMDNFARFAKIKEFPPLDVSKVKALSSAFRDPYGLERLTLNNMQSACTFVSTFTNATHLAELRITGTVGQSIDLHWSPLNKDSVLSCISVLSDTSTGVTASFKKTAVNAVFTTDEWNALVATKSNWTITLA